MIAGFPIIERIAVTLYERLQLITAGYSSSIFVREVIRPTRIEDFKPQHFQVVLTQDDPEEVPELSMPGNPPAKAMRARFNVHCHLLPSEKDPTPIDKYINIFESDIIRVVTEGGDAYWQTFGGLAIDASIGPKESISPDGGIDGFTLPVFITYRTSEINPYTLRV